MADSSYEKGLTEFSRMKVTDLKTELKKRNLSTTGNKQELIDRLQSYIHGDVSLSLDETNEEILDEDAVLEDVELEELTSKSDSPNQIGEKRKLPAENNTMNAKKVILNRNPIIEEVKVSTPIVEEKNGKDKESTTTEKKIIKLSELSSKERLEMRAKKFGMPLSESAKKEARLARFNVNNMNSNSAASIKTPVATSYEVLKKRAERFGATVSSVLEKADQQARIEKRKARFGEVKPSEKVFNNKIKIVK